MNVWVVNAVIIEAMAGIGVLSAVITRRLQPVFAVGFNTMLPVAGVYLWNAPPLNTRKILLLAMLIMYLMHMNWLLLRHSRHTAISRLEQKLPPSQKYALPFILTNTAGWGYCLPFYFAAQRTEPLGWGDYLAVGIFALGFVTHVTSEYQKRKFKARPDARGKILDTGLWSLCRHPNYLGDFLIYVSFATIGGRLWGWVSPLLNFLQYLFDAIPKNEAWMAERYGKLWDEYARRTKKLIPFVY
ncbi:MAG: DUF1295 domain-containing protein [Calditrichaeota bacterium]|nr:MAG: DUF1295 domain-containing protein [Calditrichota bacterium]